MGFLGFLTRRQRHVQELLGKYMDCWIGCMRTFRDAWQAYLTEGQGEEFFYRVSATHKEESRADDLRRQIELDLYSKALLPESRGDILGILETVDELLSQAEWVLYEVQLQRLEIADEIKGNLTKLVDLTCSCCEVVNKAVRIVFVGSGRPDDLVDLTAEIDTLESEADHMERRLIRAVFAMDIALGEKILVKELVRQVAALSDCAERVADRLTLVSVKRRI